MTSSSIWTPGSPTECCALPPTSAAKNLIAGSGISLIVDGDNITIQSTISDYTLSGVTATFIFTAADGQTTFTLPSTTQIAAGVDVFRNGVKLLQSVDYYTLGLDITLYQPCVFGTAIEVQAKTNVVIGDTNLQEVIGYSNAAAASAAAAAQSALDAAANAAVIVADHVLEADPHTQYVLDTDLTAMIAAYYTSAQVDTLLGGYSLTSHDHAGVYQPLDTELTAIAALAVTDGNIIVGNGTTWVAESGAVARSSLGLGSGNSVTFASVTAHIETAQIKTDNTGLVWLYPGYTNLDYVARVTPSPGTGDASSIVLHNSYDYVNAATLTLSQDATAAYVLAGKTGTGTALPLRLGANNAVSMSLQTDGNLLLSGNTGIGGAPSANTVLYVHKSDASGLQAGLAVANDESGATGYLLATGTTFAGGGAGFPVITDAVHLRATAQASNGLVLTAYTGEVATYVNSTLIKGFAVTQDGRIYGTALHNNAGSVAGTTNQYVASGTYAPTASALTNLDSATVVAMQWMRVGNVVTLSGAFTVDPTTNGVACAFEIPPPIASNFGSGAHCGGGGSAVSGINSNLTVIANSTNDTLVVHFLATNTAAYQIFFTATYLVI